MESCVARNATTLISLIHCRCAGRKFDAHTQSQNRWRLDVAARRLWTRFASLLRTIGCPSDPFFQDSDPTSAGQANLNKPTCHRTADLRFRPILPQREVQPKRNQPLIRPHIGPSFLMRFHSALARPPASVD